MTLVNTYATPRCAALAKRVRRCDDDARVGPRAYSKLVAHHTTLPGLRVRDVLEYGHAEVARLTAAGMPADVVALARACDRCFELDADYVNPLPAWRGGGGPRGNELRWAALH